MTLSSVQSLRNLPFLIPLLIGLVSCFEPSPKDVLSMYYAALTSGNYQEAYEYISSIDKMETSKEMYLETQNGENVFTSMISYEVGEITVNQDSASAEVEVTHPDIGAIFSGILGLSIASAFSQSGDASSSVEESIAERYKNENMAMVTKKTIVNLVKEEDGWKLFLNLKDKRIAKENKEKITKLMERAAKLEENSDFGGAVEIYAEVLDTDGGSAKAKQALEDAEKNMMVYESKQKYISEYITLYDAKSKYHNKSSHQPDGVPGVKFKIKNGGDKTLTKVQVTAYFKDKSGNVISENKFHPVSSSSFSSSTPLKPNYIWQSDQGTFYAARSVPSEWNEGAVELKVTDIEFDE